MNDEPEKIGKQTSTQIQGRQVLNLVQREAAARGEDTGSTSTTVSAITSFLEMNGYSLDSVIAPEFVDRVERAIIGGRFMQAPDIKFSPGVEADPAYPNRIDSFVHAYNALAEADFSETLCRWLGMNKHQSYKQISLKCGLRVNCIKALVTDRRRFATQITVAQALKLDQVLSSGGELFFSYIATTQHVAYETPPTVMDQILGRIPFSQQMRHYRNRLNVTKDELLKAISDKSGIQIAKCSIADWESGLCLPCQGMREAIAALDDICNANGELVGAWLAQNPREIFAPYSFPAEQWPASLHDQLARIVRYKTGNPENLPRNKRRADRWSAEAIANFTTFCQGFLGFLRSEKNTANENLSLSLLCDWELVQGFFDFRRERAGRTNYSLHAQTTTRTLLNLYTYFMPATWEETVGEPHWTGRITLEVRLQVAVAKMVKRTQTIRLKDLSQSWRHHLALAKASAQAFLKQSSFDDDPMIERVSPLLEDEVSVARIAALVAARVANLPLLILCRKSAILLRRLALVALLLARHFLPAILRSLATGQVTVTSGGKIRLDIPGSQFRSRGKGGSKGGVEGDLPDVGWIHEVIRRYLLEGRPLLLGKAAALNGRHASYVFIPAQGRRVPGSPLTKKELAADVEFILGYNPLSHRYVFISDAWNRHMPKEDMAVDLQTTTEMVQRILDRLAQIKTRRANRTTLAVLNKQNGQSGKGRPWSL